MSLDTPKTEYGKKKNKLTTTDYEECEKANEALAKAFAEKHKQAEVIEMDMNEFLNK